MSARRYRLQPQLSAPMESEEEREEAEIETKEPEEDTAELEVETEKPKVQTEEREEAN